MFGCRIKHGGAKRRHAPRFSTAINALCANENLAVVFFTGSDEYDDLSNPKWLLVLCFGRSMSCVREAVLLIFHLILFSFGFTKWGGFFLGFFTYPLYLLSNYKTDASGLDG